MRIGRGKIEFILCDLSVPIITRASWLLSLGHICASELIGGYVNYARQLSAMVFRMIHSRMKIEYKYALYD